MLRGRVRMCKSRCRCQCASRHSFTPTHPRTHCRSHQEMYAQGSDESLVTVSFDGSSHKGGDSMVSMGRPEAASGEQGMEAYKTKL